MSRRTNEERAPSGGRAFRWWAAGGAAVFVALTAWDLWVLHPGLGAPEELAALSLARHAGATWSFAWARPGEAPLTRALQALAAALVRGAWSLSLVNALALGLTAWGLGRWGRRLGGDVAAAAALALLAACPFAFLQARTAFSYVLTPGLLLAAAALLERPWGAAASATFGLGLALAAQDYPGFAFGLPGLAALWLSRGAGRRVSAWAALGLAAGAGLAVLAALHGSAAAAPILPVGRALGGVGANLRAFFWGDPRGAAMGLGGEAAILPWALPGLLAAVGEAPAWLWLWAVGGLGALCFADPFPEPQRAVAAWTACLLLGGLGTARLLRTLPRGVTRAALGAALLAAPVWGFLRYDRARAPWDARVMGPSRTGLEVADFLEARARVRDVRLGPPLEALLTPWVEAAAAGRLGHPGAPPETWVLVPGSEADPADPRWGRWIPFRAPDGGADMYLLRPSPEALALFLRAREDFPQQAWLVDPFQLGLAALRGVDARPLSPWARGEVAAWRLRAALVAGDLEAGDLAELFSGSLVSTEPLRALADAARGRAPGIAARAEVELAALRRPGERWRRAHGAPEAGQSP